MKKEKKYNKQFLVFILIILVFLGIFLSWLLGWGVKKKSSEVFVSNITSTPAKSLIELKEEEKPEIKLNIVSDRSGAVLIVNKIPNNFEKVEYELVYVAESDGREMERGVAGGPITVGTNREIREQLLFGTESCTTGVCKRHIDKNVSGGTLTVRLITEQNQYWLFEKSFTIEKASQGYLVAWKE